MKAFQIRTRRGLALLLIVLLALSLAGCGAAEEASDPAPAPEAAETPAPEPAEEPESAPEPVSGGLNIRQVPDLAEDFVMGADISSLIAELDSGVVYYDYDGSALTDAPAFCGFLADCGLTHARIRIWNDPYDSEGHGYGGGNNGVETALEIAKGCAGAGLKLLLDFHLSDFWADPGKQMPPKAWEGMTAQEKAQAAGDFIAYTIAKVQETGAQVDMVQIGNEITGGVAGEKDYADMCAIFSAGAKAVHDAGARAVIHVTNPEQGNVTGWAKILDDNGVDYDILATSYYPYWHGTFENLASELSAVRDAYGKDVMVAETSYAYTLNDSDGFSNTFGEGSSIGNAEQPFTPQGQAMAIRDLIEVVNGAGGIGVFYWEPAWITVGDTTGLTGADFDSQLAANKAKWEEQGSGWAASYAGSYDPDDAGKWYGGTAIDNEAFFTPDGRPLEGLKIWRYVYTGVQTDSVTLEGMEQPDPVTAAIGGELLLPETVKVYYNNGSINEPAVWDSEAVSAIDTSSPGEYTVNGTVSLSQEVDSGETELAVSVTVTVSAGSLIPDAQAAGFESGEGFVIEGAGISDIPAGDDPHSGEGSLHWWDVAEQTSSVTYTVPTDLEPGSYRLSAFAQGYAGDTVTLEILDGSGEVIASGEPAELSGWVEWKEPTVEFTLKGAASVQLRIVIHMQASGWGTCDDLSLIQTA